MKTSKKHQKSTVDNLNKKKKKKRDKLMMCKSEVQKEEKKLSKKAKDIRKLQLLEANKEEDKLLSKLEKALKLKKRKRKKNKSSTEKIPSMFVDDGLDFILDVLDKDKCQQESDFSNEEDINEDLLEATKKDFVEKPKIKRMKNRPDETEPKIKKPRTLADLLNEQNETISEISRHSDNKICIKSEEEVTDSDAAADDDEEESISSDASDEDSSDIKKTSNKLEVWEDIYGRLRDSEGNVIKRENIKDNIYIPPAKRCKSVNEDKEEILKIQRQLKGLLNRLSESNMKPICSQIEEMYMKHSRNNVNETLKMLVTESVLSPVLTPPRLIMEQAMMIALLHANVGSEIGAYFLQSLANKLDELFKLNANYGDGKECNNIIVFLCHLYNFKVSHCTLIFDILKIFIESFQDKDIELIQLIFKNVGFTLRKDNPLKLKEIILSIQAKAPMFKSEENNSRVKFMLETLTAIRNNNMYKIPDYDPSIVEHAKKLLRGLIRGSCSIQELAISFDDLLKAEERGRWWIIGSAWSDKETVNSEKTTESYDNAVLSKSDVSEKILELARKQHMNTETRKTIFCIIMTAEDYIDAFEKLLRLNLKNQQEREIISVLLHCSLQEKGYNPYYAYLVGKFCKFSRKYYISLQFALWDKFKEFSNLKPHQIKNLAHFLAHLFTTEALSMSVLKVVHFSEMNKSMVRFFRQILLAVLLHESEEVCCQVFRRISQAQNLNLLREALRLFMHHFLLKNKSSFESSVAEKLIKRVKLADDTLNAAKHVFKL